MLRDNWEFEYTASKLAEAAGVKADAHQAKFEWWEKKKSEVMQQVRATGIEVHDSVAAGYSNTKGGYGPQIAIDAGLQRDLCECQSKLLEHSTLVKEYNGWIQVLRANSEARLKLNHDDWLHFFGK